MTDTITITREFDAPVAVVWRAWTDAQLIKRWWGPEHFTAPAVEIDFRVGGKWHYCMRDPDGNDYWGTGVFQEIEPMKRIVYTDSFADAEGNVISPTHYGFGDDFPLETQATVTFEDLGGRTRLTMVGTDPGGKMTEMTREGWRTSLDKLAGVVEE